MPVESQFKPLDIPETDIWGLLFERKDRAYPDNKVIYVESETSRSYTYAQVKATAIDFGKGLKSVWEWVRGDVVAFYTPNSIDTPAVLWGVHWAGGVATLANPAYNVDEFTHQLKDSGAKAIVTQVAQLKIAIAAADKVGIPHDRIILLGDERDPSGNFKHFSSVRNLAGTNRYRRSKAKSEDLAFLVYSSGTTGLPKGVMLSHKNVVANIMQGHAGEYRLTWDGNDDGRGDNVLSFLPIFHIYGLTCCVHMALYVGWRLTIMPAFSIEKFCAAVQHHKITFAYVVPPVVLLLGKHACVESFDLSSLRMMNSGAAPLTRELVEQVHKRINVPVKQGYGLSETSPTTHTQPWELWQSHTGSAGRLLPNLTVKYMDESGKEVPVGQTGELWIKGPSVFKGYLNNPEGTANALTADDYFKTGDIGNEDADGNLYITDRVKELIKYKGFQVAPAELEGLLVSHPRVSDAAVIGIYDESRGSEVPRAYIVPSDGLGKAGPELGNEIIKWLAGKVAGHKQLRGGVAFVEEVPKSPSGKILRRILKKKAEEEKTKAGSKARL